MGKKTSSDLQGLILSWQFTFHDSNIPRAFQSLSLELEHPTKNLLIEVSFSANMHQKTLEHTISSNNSHKLTIENQETVFSKNHKFTETACNQDTSSSIPLTSTTTITSTLTTTTIPGTDKPQETTQEDDSMIIYSVSESNEKLVAISSPSSMRTGEAGESLVKSDCVK